MPRTKSDVQAIAQQQQAGQRFEILPNVKVRVWWPPTEDESKTDYAGMYWPVTVVAVDGEDVKVKYDNGEVETVKSEHLQPAKPPVEFGKEAIHFQVCRV